MSQLHSSALPSAKRYDKRYEDRSLNGEARPSYIHLPNRQAMYAYIRHTERGFFDGVHALNDQACISTDPPPPSHSWIASCQSCLRLSRFVPLTAGNVYSLLPYLVLGNKLQDEE